MNAIKKLMGGMLFACGLFVSVNAQEIPWCFPDTVTKVATSGRGGIYLYTFDDRGNALVTEYIEHDATGTQIPQQKITAVYNRFDLVDTTVSYQWRSGGYMAAARKIARYDNRGNLIYLLNENGDGNDGWTPANRYTYTYNEKNLKTDVLIEKPLDVEFDQWTPSEKARYVYDGKDRELSYEHSVYVESAWYHYRSTFNKYENDNLVQEIGMGLSQEGVFDSTYKLSYAYNAAGKQVEWLYEVFVDGAWENSDLRRFFYDADGYDTMVISYQWNLYSTGIWDSTVKEVYKNRPDGQRIRVDHYTAEGADPGEWFLAAYMEFEYNEAGRRTAYNYSSYNQDNGGDFRYEFELNENNDDVRATCFVKKGGDWVPTDRINLEAEYHDGTSILYANEPMHEIRVHYKSGTKSPIPDDVANQAWQAAPDFSVRVYPNPAREILSVEADENGYFDMELYDLSGRMIESRRAVQCAEFNVSHYHGVYLLRVEKNGSAVSRKVVIL
ncbi:MAG: T9SS type A sorting domain-containing protein [Bacteroidales bacterium]|nr:T9SS type A sorting domain-containing protein [Bacteroidales bacterium]